MGRNAFAACDSLKSVSLPNHDVSYGLSVFYKCKSLNRITIPEGQTVVAESMFSNCKSLKSITLPSTLVSIGRYAFMQTSVASVVIPEGVTELGDHCFAYCNSLTAVTLLDSLRKFDASPFWASKKLKTVTSPSRSYADVWDLENGYKRYSSGESATPQRFLVDHATVKSSAKTIKYHAADNLFDGKPDKWFSCSSKNASTSITFSLCFPEQITGYTVWAGMTPSSAPTDWELYASEQKLTKAQDKGWILIDSRQDIVFPKNTPPLPSRRTIPASTSALNWFCFRETLNWVSLRFAEPRSGSSVVSASHPLNGFRTLYR